jgi:LacI family transcriptional regulator
LNYGPDGVARALQARRTWTIGLVIPDNCNPFFAQLATAIEDQAFRAGYVLLVGNSTDDPERERQYLKTLHERRIDALLLVSVRAAEELTSDVDTSRPVLMLDRRITGASFSSVVIDNEGAARAGTEHLMSHGHRKIAFIAGPEAVAVAAERKRGWRGVMRDVGQSCPPRWVHHAPFTRGGGYEALGELMLQRDRPTAVLVSSDTQAIGALHAAWEAGIRVPEDLAVVSIDGIDEARFSIPTLTTIAQPVHRIARSAIELVVHAIEAGEDGTQVNEVVPFELTLGESCGCH